ncbi:cytochrome C biogenesis protein CcmC [Oceanidesulfovibrio indonesiensis]|uniref:Heme exporter protein C n=1 Tax=Oceanidesulfovibrio indonesiensis TaxID=54767 RepID=A0A7M3MJH5_9BACT|nr:cytochrome c biogenesis protein CcsA [Oceanidesulfovibrio indonesiensis]TVM19925.1 cytochrome C biogenesis protein CcmC [Oceanidesulfovibrio indonesiensis]
MNIRFLLALAAGVAVFGSQLLVWLYAPVEMTLGPIQKIFYLHLPCAWWALMSFFVVFVASIAYLLKRNFFWDRLAGAAAELGVLLALLALATGSIWGRVSWNVWWTWDPRLTTTLVMWFIYAGYLLIRSLSMQPGRRAVVSAVLGIVAFLDVPLVFYSARLWRSIHPAVFSASGGGLEPEMKLTLFVCLGAFGLLWAALLLGRLWQMNAAERIEARIIWKEH